MKDKIYGFVEDGVLTLQPAPYIDDGWLIVVKGEKFITYEVNDGCEEDISAATHSNFMDAYNEVKSWT